VEKKGFKDNIVFLYQPCYTSTTGMYPGSEMIMNPSTPSGSAVQNPPVNKSLPTILVCDDDAIFRRRLVRAFQTRGYETLDAPTPDEAIELVKRFKPQRAVLDLKMPGKTGLDLLSELIKIDPDIDIVILTGFGSIASAVEAVHRGAMDYLTKPADADQILAAFERDGELPPQVPDNQPTLARVEWEHIQRVLTECGNNISQAARKLGIHRRSLQRKLAKLPPFE
jgi:two-component system response regulator RegA